MKSNSPVWEDKSLNPSALPSPTQTPTLQRKWEERRDSWAVSVPPHCLSVLGFQSSARVKSEVNQIYLELAGLLAQSLTRSERLWWNGSWGVGLNMGKLDTRKSVSQFQSPLDSWGNLNNKLLTQWGNSLYSVGISKIKSKHYILTSSFFAHNVWNGIEITRHVKQKNIIYNQNNQKM